MIVALTGLFSYLFCIPRLLCLCRVETLESFHVHSFNGVIISSARVCTFTITFRIPLPPDIKLYLIEDGVIISSARVYCFTITLRIHCVFFFFFSPFS